MQHWKKSLEFLPLNSFIIRLRKSPYMIFLLIVAGFEHRFISIVFKDPVNRAAISYDIFLSLV